MKPKILLTGRNGQVGGELNGLLGSFAEVISLERAELDLCRPNDIRHAVRSIRPNIIVNAAAYTAVDRAESEEAIARAVNAHAPAVMAEEAKALGTLLVHYSTDYVFDGEKRTPYIEEDSPNPQSVYGTTKLAGERAIQQSGAAHLIFRTAWVYAKRGKNFLLTILKLASQNEELRIVQDQIGSPTFAGDIAGATSQIIKGLCDEGSDVGSICGAAGVYHMTSAGETSWYGFAKAILEETSCIESDLPWLADATSHRSLAVRRVVPISTDEYPTPARRPAYSVLSNARLTRSFGVQLPDWRVQLHSAFVGNGSNARGPSKSGMA